MKSHNEDYCKRVLTTIGVLLMIGLGVFVYGGWQMFGDEVKAIRSLKMIKDRVYTFEYRGDYGFKEPLRSHKDIPRRWICFNLFY